MAALHHRCLVTTSLFPPVITAIKAAVPSVGPGCSSHWSRCSCCGTLGEVRVITIAVSAVLTRLLSFNFGFSGRHGGNCRRNHYTVLKIGGRAAEMFNGVVKVLTSSLRRTMMRVVQEATREALYTFLFQEDLHSR